jgi:hypothetical protein
MPPRSDLNAHVTDGYVCVPHTPRGTLVQRIRLADVGEVHAAVKEVRVLAREAEQTRATWWVGELSTPDDIIDLLLAEGLEPDPQKPMLASLVLERKPNGSPPSIELERVQSLDHFLQALEIDLITMGIPAEERERMADPNRALWEVVQADGLVQTYLARVDGRPVAFARAAYGKAAVALLGGGTLEEERGKGYYTALVHVRWKDAVAHGTPLVFAQALPQSRPILLRLGFEQLGEIRLLVDNL